MRDEFVTLADVRRIEKLIQAETIRLHQDDGLSTVYWVSKLREEDSVLAFKAKSDLPPSQSGLNKDLFLLCIQTEGQRKMLCEFGASFAAVEGTHNTTQYKDITLSTLLVHDQHGHGKFT